MRLVATVAPPAATPPAAADLVEVRLDLLAPEAAAKGIASSPRPVLATLRSRREGGVFDGSPAEAAARVRDAARSGAAWIDVESDVAAALPARDLPPGTKRLASVHTAAGDPRLPARDADAWKVARRVEDGPGVESVLAEARDLAARAKAGEIPPPTVVPYGPFAGPLRVVTAAIAAEAGGDPFVFGSAAADGGTGALRDQPSLAALLDVFRLGEVPGTARLYGLLGRPPGASPSPALHAAVFRALRIDAVYLPAADLDPDRAFALPYAGFSVTTPLKEAAAERCAYLDFAAARAGAANTVVRGDDGRLWGWNTDAEAVAEALRERLPPAPAGARGAVVVGGGGFARAAVVALEDQGFAVRVAGGERARRLADDFEVEHVGPSASGALAREGDAVVVNATPVGSDGSLDDAFVGLVASIPPGALAIDAPYAQGCAPAAFAIAARARGLEVVDGADLLVRQARGQALRFCGRLPPAGVLALAAAPALPSLCLVGPRGVGKSTVGREVATRLGRPFVDTDDEIARRAGAPAGRVLADRGEAAFRAIEREAVEAALSRRGAVIAMGGGALSTPQVAEAVRARAFVVRLTATPVEAARRTAADPTPRPRLTDAPDLVTEAERVAAARESAYAAAAHAEVATDDRPPSEVAARVADLYVARTRRAN
jgi:shikimate 5-dehydrogenase/shikimate kinase